jgi:hypothetical protein
VIIMARARSDAFSPNPDYPGSWINLSTGVEITRLGDGAAMIAYRVRGSNGLRIMTTGKLATARVAGKERVREIWAERDAAHAEALIEQEERNLAYARRQFPSVFEMLDAKEGFDPEAGDSAPEANRHPSQTMGIEPVRFPKPAGRPAGWGDAWLEVQHPGRIDLVYGPMTLDAARFLGTTSAELSKPGPY